MTDKQLVVLSGDTVPAAALFGGRLDVIEGALCNGEITGREVLIVACPDVNPEGAAAVWRIETAPDWGKFSTWIEVRDWLRLNRISESAPPATSLNGALSPALSPEGGGPSAIPAEAVHPAPSDPAGSDSSHASGDWTQDIPPEPATLKTRPMPRKRPKLGLVESDGNTALQPDADLDPLPAALSEDALAQHFIENYGENWRFVPEWGVWLQWRGDGWYRDTKHEVASVLMRVTRDALGWRDAAGLTADGKRKINSKRTAWNCRDVAGVDPRIAILAEELDADPMILGVPGGIVDLTNGKLLDAEPSQYVTRRTSVMPKDGPTPLFDLVLSKACAEHDGMAEYLFRWFGYMLTGDVREESFVFLYGPGGSGKSTLIKCLTEILHDYGTSISMEALMEQKNPRHTQEIAKLSGARLIYASETAEGRMWNESLIKDLTGRDKVTARFMRGNDFTFQPIGKLLLYGNAMPRLKSVGEEIRRRIHLIEYAGSIAPEDRDTLLKDKLVAEYPAILARMIRGCVDWLDCAGLGKPESVEKSVENYLEGEDGFAQFLDDCIIADANGKELSGEVYARYRSWGARSGEYVMAQKRFVQQMRGRGYEPARGSGGVRIIKGLKLRSAPQDYPPPHQSERD